jgi:4,5-DOPA dioxygenase extradiol
MIPPLFVSHGAPTLPMTDTPARHFLSRLAGHLPRRPKAILAVSAHWETETPAVSAMPVNTTIHDFYGFPEALYELRYDAPGAPMLAAEVARLLQDAGLAASIDAHRGLDHGAWVPLLLAWPDADVPVIQLSLQTELGPAHHLAIGRALAPLAERDVLIMGSGSFTHDLSEFRTYRHAIDAPEPDWVRDFALWFDQALAEDRVDDLVGYRGLAPHAARNHPTEEHLLPLFVALGAAGEGARAERLHSSTTHAVLRMDVYSFARPQ